MRNPILRFFLVFAHLFSVLDFVQAEDRLQQFGGDEIKDDEFFWFAVIRRVPDDKFICGASLIGKRHVLTASHCVESRPKVRVEVGYLCKDEGNCGREKEFFGVSDLQRHSDFVFDGGDLALLVLDREVSLDITPAVPNLGPDFHPHQQLLKKGLVMTMVGAGREGSGGDRSFRVEKLEVKYFPNKKKCRSKLTNPLLVGDYVICSFAQGGNPCDGDSGSALVVPGKSYWEGRDVVMAIHVFGPSRCSEVTDRPIGHFLLSSAADFLYSAVCEGDFPEEWCVVPTDAPTNAPVQGGIFRPVDFCTQLTGGDIRLVGGDDSIVFPIASSHFFTCRSCAAELLDSVDVFFLLEGIDEETGSKKELAILKSVKVVARTLEKIKPVLNEASFTRNQGICAKADSQLDGFDRNLKKCENAKKCSVTDDLLDNWDVRSNVIQQCCSTF